MTSNWKYKRAIYSGINASSGAKDLQLLKMWYIARFPYKMVT